jgi:hypothetical protein
MTPERVPQQGVNSGHLGSLPGASWWSSVQAPHTMGSLRPADSKTSRASADQSSSPRPLFTEAVNRSRPGWLPASARPAQRPPRATGGRPSGLTGDRSRRGECPASDDGTVAPVGVGHHGGHRQHLGGTCLGTPCFSAKANASAIASITPISLHHTHQQEVTGQLQRFALSGSSAELSRRARCARRAGTARSSGPLSGRGDRGTYRRLPAATV